MELQIEPALAENPQISSKLSLLRAVLNAKLGHLTAANVSVSGCQDDKGRFLVRVSITDYGHTEMIDLAPAEFYEEQLDRRANDLLGRVLQSGRTDPPSTAD